MSNERIEQLISRIVDGDVDEVSWRELEVHAAREPALWPHLARAQRDHSLLASAVGAVAARAECVDAPMAGGHHRFTAGAWAGWALAAIVGLAWVIGLRPTMRPAETASPPVMTAGFTSPEDAFRRYLELAQEQEVVLQEIPTRILIDSRPLVDGSGYELLYLRQVIERTVVPELYHLEGRDEAGQPSLVKYRPRTGRTM
jgi:hypothetical protein